MQVFIMRHGEAQNPVGHSLMSDKARELTKQGKFEVQLMSSWLTKVKADVGQLWVSPYIRAQQTCAIMAKKIHVEAETIEFITPEGDAKQVHDFIDGIVASQLENLSVNDNKSTILEQPKALLIVSHMPLVSYLVAELTHYQAAPIFATAAIAEIDYDIKSMRGELVRLISPLDLC